MSELEQIEQSFDLFQLQESNFEIFVICLGKFFIFIYIGKMYYF